jgi:hypothetical protein
MDVDTTKMRVIPRREKAMKSTSRWRKYVWMAC